MSIIIDKQTALKLGLKTEKPSKLRNEKTVIDGIKFDSKREGQRYSELKMLEKAGVIKNLRLQVPFELIPAQYNDKKLLERAVTYKADFVYDYNGFSVVEDTKGVRTKEYIIKRKLMLYIHNIKIKEI